MLINYRFIHHMKVLWGALEPLGLEAWLSVKDFYLTVRWQDQSVTLHPQFSARPDGKLRYTPVFSDQIESFIGWRPYFNKVWDLSSNKLAFKKYLIECGLPTPIYTYRADAVIESVVVKKAQSSFSHGLRGPFRYSTDTHLDTKQGEYFETFIPGRIVKLWFWNSTPVAAELAEMLGVFGDGVSSVAELVIRHGKMIGQETIDLAQFEEFLAYQGKTLGSVPARDEECKIDYRYNSVIPISFRARDIKIGEEGFFGLEPFLKLVGEKVWHGIPEKIRQDVVYSVDAILDDHQQLWLLEMNCNPYVHPYVYPHMLKSIRDRLAQRGQAVAAQ